VCRDESVGCLVARSEWTFGHENVVVDITLGPRRISVHVDVTCKTDRFNLSVVGTDFINDCCFGEDFSKWLVSALESQGVGADLLCMEDCGWANLATFEGVSYLICVAGNSEEESSRPNFGTWHVMVERHRTFKEKLLGRNKTTVEDLLVHRVMNVLRSAGFADVVAEP
jgi:hypothetical protein